MTDIVILRVTDKNRHLKQTVSNTASASGAIIGFDFLVGPVALAGIGTSCHTLSSAGNHYNLHFYCLLFLGNF
jgi:hypothetical protein